MVGQAGPDTPAAGVALLPVQAGDESVTVGDAHLLFTAEYSRLGDDLLLTGSDGTTQIVSGYFALDVPPALFSPDGAMISADLVAALVGPRVPGLQYAQAGGAPAADAIGQVETLTGSAQVIRAGAAVDLAVGDPVFQGDIVQTGAGSALGITFIDETVFSLSGGARMVLNSMVYNPGGSANSMLFDLVQGTFVFVTGKVAPTGDMRIETPVATIGVRGTAPITKISAIDGTSLFSIGENPGGGVGAYQLFNKLTGLPLLTISSLDQLVRIQSAGGSYFESIKTPDMQALDRTLVLRAHDTYSRSQQRLGEEDRGESGEFQQATDEAPPVETAAGQANAVTSGGLGVDEPEFGEEKVTDTDIESSEGEDAERNNAPPSSSTYGSSIPSSNAVGGAPTTTPGAPNTPPVVVAGDGEIGPNGIVPVTAELLSASDAETTDPALLVFTVTETINGEIQINGEPVNSFTQAQVDAGLVSFIYALSDSGTASFTVTAADPDGGVSAPATVDLQVGAGGGDAGLAAVDLAVDGDVVAPGASAGTQEVSGNFTLNSGTLEIELGGTDVGQSDLIDVAGEADVQGGLVEFTLIDGYIPSAGDSIEFLVAGEGLTGSPENLSSAFYGVTADFDYQLDVGSDGISFTALSDAQVGNSTIFQGGALDDVFAGGDGEDVLRGGAGADTLSGGAGNDLFILAPGEGGATLGAADVLTDFEDGADLIGLAGGLQYSDLTIGASGTGGSTITVTATNEILASVEGIAPIALDSDDFTTVV